MAVGSRQKDHPGNVVAEVGAATLWNFLRYPLTGFNPFDENEPSVRHYNSNPIFAKVSFELWKAHASDLKRLVKIQFRNDPFCKGDWDLPKEELERFLGQENPGPSERTRQWLAAQGGTNVDTSANISTNNNNINIDTNGTGINNSTSTSTENNTNKRTTRATNNNSNSNNNKSNAKTRDNSRANNKVSTRVSTNAAMTDLTPKRRSKRISYQNDDSCDDDVLVVSYPAPDTRYFVLFDVDGEIAEPSSQRFVFSECGTKVTRYCRIPEILFKSDEMMSKLGRSYASHDAFQMLMRNETQRRLKIKKSASMVELEGYEEKQTAKLTVPVDPVLYNENGEAVQDFEIKSTEEGYAYVYFWLKKTTNSSSP